MVAVALSLMTMAAGASAAPLLLHTPANPGESDPPTGQSLFDDLFKTEAGYALPFPFEKLVAAIENANADNKVTGVLIPLGRSLQRLSADPDYFTSPRVVIGVDTDSPDSVIALKDRLFIGYQAKSAVIEVVSYNDSVGRFEYQTVNDYDGTGQPVVDYAERSVCLECHQGHAPIFPKALWRETNANPAVAERLGEARIVHGVPVNRGVDAPDALDRATDRANRFALGQFFWGRVCENMQPNCQADLLLAALRYRLGGARRPWTAREDEALGQRLQKAVIDLAPDGVAIITPDLPDRNPLEAVEAGVTPVEAVESEGIFDPTQPRDPIMLVTPDPDAADTLATAVAEIARFISPAMVRDIGEALTSANTATRVTFTAPCRINRYERSNGAREMRFVCRTLQEETSNLRLSGYIIEDNNGFVRGTLAELAPAEYTPVRGLKVAAAFRAGSTLSLTLAEQSYGLPARLASGEALSHLEIDLDDGNGQARISVADDIVLLRKAVNAISASALAPPIRARALTADLLAALSRQGGS